MNSVKGRLDMTPAGLPHSEILGSKPVWRLPEAYRSLPRPSSPASAKASTCCPYYLNPDAQPQTPISLSKNMPTPGGGERNRTDGPLRAKQVLSQLSYTPFGISMVGLDRLELSTSRLSGVRSNHLSYRPTRTRDYTAAWLPLPTGSNPKPGAKLPHDPPTWFGSQRSLKIFAIK